MAPGPPCSGACPHPRPTPAPHPQNRGWTLHLHHPSQHTTPAFTSMKLTCELKSISSSGRNFFFLVYFHIFYL